MEGKKYTTTKICLFNFKTGYKSGGSDRNGDSDCIGKRAEESNMNRETVRVLC
jgi:hypothetical protein